MVSECGRTWRMVKATVPLKVRAPLLGWVAQNHSGGKQGIGPRHCAKCTLNQPLRPGLGNAPDLDGILGQGNGCQIQGQRTWQG